MIDNKKEQEREELHRAIWAIADELRGAVDGWDFKNYVLGTMFYRYISENITAYINDGEHKAGNKEFNYEKLSDKEAEQAREDLVKEKGFFILPSELFCNVRAKAMNDENLNETLERVFSNIEKSAQGSDSENSFAGLFDDFDVNSNKLGSTVAKRNERLAKLLDGIAAMNLGNVKDHDIDAFGDAYEYLMTMYASNAGKSGGEFFTPADVSELLTRLGTVGKKTINKVYDPACGSGSLLLKAEKVLGKDAVLNGFYGQEINITTYNLCRINMFLHDIGFDKFDIACEDTLINPQHWDDEPFELIVSNPPYSIKWAGDDNPLLINDQRFAPAGVLAPKNNADFAFILHSLSWLAANGTAAIVCFPGIFTRTNNKAEPKIRKYLIDNNYIDCIIQLPGNLFFGTPIATCILVMKKGKTDNKVLFIEASDEFVKVGNNNKLTPDGINKIISIYEKRTSIEFYSHLADYEEIKKAKFDLSVSTYVKSKGNKKKIDIDSLNLEIDEIVDEENKLRAAIKNAIKNIGR
jgi:type I restriction enzyme M protein